MNDNHFRALLNVFMCCDPWPASEEDHEQMTDLLDSESKERGMDNWVVAYHEFKP